MSFNYAFCSWDTMSWFSLIDDVATVIKAAPLRPISYSSACYYEELLQCRKNKQPDNCPLVADRGNNNKIPFLVPFRFNFRTFRWTQTMLFAINEINKNKYLLPNTDLGYVIYDSCFTISKAVEGTLTYLTGQDEAVPNYRCGDGAPLAALVGAGGSDLSIATARILGLYHFPQVGQWQVRLE